MKEYANVPSFGVAGFPPDFFESELGKKRENIFRWLKSLNLDWIELQCTRGVKMKPDQARLYRELANQHGIGISIHGPYFISLASGDMDVVRRSRERILQCIALAVELHCERIIFHPGFFPGNSEDDRTDAVKRIIQELNWLRGDVPDGIEIFPETAGKCSQIGSVDEILEICEHVEFAKPCIDLAHVHAFERGSLWSSNDIVNVIEKIKSRFGAEYINKIHIHMYPVAYDSHGEKVHKAFNDMDMSEAQVSFFDNVIRDRYYPRAEDFVDAIRQLKIYPVVVCEAHNTQNVGAALMKKIYFSKMESL